jgi:hypothetical protein
MAASIPVLRVLIREVKAGSMERKYSSKYGDHMSSRKTRLQTNIITVVGGGGYDSARSFTQYDDCSDKGILGGIVCGAEMKALNNIRCTNEISVAVEYDNETDHADSLKCMV